MKLQLARAQALLNQSKPKPDEAMKVLQPLVNRKNAPWPVYHFSGIAFLQKKEYGTALSFLNESIKQGADEAETHHSISICYYHLGNYELAEEHEEIALRKKPDFFKGWLHLGSVYRAQAKLDEALKCYQKANKLDQKSAGVAYRIGEIYNDQGDINKAYELYDIAVKIDENYNEAWLAKAEVERNRKNYEEAEDCINNVLRDEPRNLAARVALAEHFKHIGNYEKAIELYEKMLPEFPKVGGVRVNYALCLQELGRFDESEKHYMIAFEDQPGSFESLSNYLMGVHYNPERTKEEIFEAHKLWDQNFAPKERPRRPVPFDTSKEKKLRLGFISGGFRTHPVGWMITKALENLPKDQFEIYCYTTNNRYDRITKQIHAVSDKWQSVIRYNDQVIAGMIREDEIDILVELSGHSADTRLKTVALEPAPVIVKWVGGLFNTTGLKSVDYLLTDHYETPEGEEKYYTEKLIRMPDDYISFLPPEYAPEVGSLPLKKNGFVTFGCFNNPTKVNDGILVKWAQIMNHVPESRLFLKSKQYDTEALRERIINTMKENGIDEDRLRFEGLSPHDELLDKYNDVDIALDPWPYSGGLTTCEALWMGVPVVTKPGPTFAGRHSTTHLINAGLPELVADTWEEYIEKTVELAANPEKLAELRAGLRSQVEGSPLADGPRFGAHFAKAIRSVWHQWVDGFENDNENWADHIDVDALDDQQIERLVQSSKPSEDVQGILDHIENEMNGTVSDSSNKLTDPAPTNGRVNGVHENGSVSANGSENSSEVNETTQDEYKIETADGVTICTPPDLNMMTPYVLLEQKQWYENELDFVREYLKPGMSFVDVGAGFGVYALPAAKLVGNEGKVYAFEPGAIAKNHLEMSKFENSFQNLEVIGKAVSAKNGKHAWKTAETPELNRLDESGEETVSTVTLDAWWQFEGEPKIDFLKIDVNGAEADLLAGATEVLKSEMPVVLISITEKKSDVFGEELKGLGYSFYEYIPGPGILAEHEAEAGADPYMQNLIAIPDSRTEEFKKAGWLHDESVKPNAIENNLWKTELGKLPWTNDLMERWENHDDSEGILSYLQALNYLIAAEQIDITDSGIDQPRSQKAGLLLGAAQILIQLFNQGANSTSVVFTLVRTLSALGKRSQAVEVMQKLIETTKLGQQNMNVDLPFMMPIPEQDNAPIKTDLNKWLMVRTVEAWILLKDLTTYLSGPQEKKLLGVLEGNVEVIARLHEFKIPQGPGTSSLERSNGATNNVQKATKSQPKVVHLCFNHVYAQSLSDLIEYVNEHSDQQHRLYIETHRAIPNYSVEIDNNKSSSIFNFKTHLQSISQECLKDDVDMVMFHGIFFEWQKRLIKTIGDKKHIGWKLWGGDLYNPIKKGKPLTKLMKFVDSVHARVEGDFEIIEEAYGKKIFSRFGYTFPGLYGDIPSDIEKDTPKRIIIGNSGDPENEHVEILKILASKKDIQDYNLLIPVAYNLSQGYKQELAKKIKELGLHSITELHDRFIHPIDYVELVMRSGMMITAHNRQQAIGSILTSLYGGNNTFIKEEIILNGKKINNPTWRYILDHNLKAQPFEELKKVDRLAEIKEIDHDFRKRQQEIIRKEVGIETRGNELINAVAAICS